jgi:hypothetical protein
MIFRTGNGRTLWQRALYWIEEKANGLHRELHYARKDREQRYEERHQPYYDTFRSWTDELPKGHDDSGFFRLFTDTARGVHANVAHTDGPGRFPGGAIFVVHKVSVDITASDETLAERVRLGTGVELSIGHMPYLTFQLGDAERAPALLKDIVIPPYQNFFVMLSFSSEVATLLRELKTKVGPGAGWVSIRVTLDGILKREVL